MTKDRVSDEMEEWIYTAQKLRESGIIYAKPFWVPIYTGRFKALTPPTK